MDLIDDSSNEVAVGGEESAVKHDFSQSFTFQNSPTARLYLVVNGSLKFVHWEIFMSNWSMIIEVDVNIEEPYRQCQLDPSFLYHD